MSDEGKQKEIDRLKEMIIREMYIENQKPLIDTLASYGDFAKPALLDIIGNLKNIQLKEYAARKLRTMD